MQKNSFTMMELIFVIVIIAILATIAIPKLEATRTDAQAVALVEETQQIIQEVLADATAKGGGLRDRRLDERSQTLKQLIAQGKAEIKNYGWWASIYGSDGKRCIHFDEINNTTLKVYYYPTNANYIENNNNSHSPDCLKAKKILGKSFKSLSEHVYDNGAYYDISTSKVKF